MTVSGLKRGLVYRKKFLLRMRGPPGNTRREWLYILLPCITHGLVSAIFVNNTALFFSGKKGKCLYQCVKSDYLEIPRLSFVSSTRAYLLCEESI